jgi:hypothetical protein
MSITKIRYAVCVLIRSFEILVRNERLLSLLGLFCVFCVQWLNGADACAPVNLTRRAD